MSNTIIRASAGSGKTYQLSNRFLQVLFDVRSAEDVDAVLDTILASTFTTKAAGEISERILTKFADVCLDEKKRNELASGLRYPNANDVEQELRKRLAVVAKNLHRMRVGTLDSYFNKLATVFQLELELPPGWTICDDAEFAPLVDEAVREVFEDSQRTAGSKNAASELMYIIQRGQEEASVTRKLVELATKHLQLVRNTNAAAWEHNTTERCQNLLEGILNDEEVAAILAAWDDITEDQLPKTKAKTPVAAFVKVHAKIADQIRSGDWEKFLAETIVGAVVPSLEDDANECVYSRCNVRQDAPQMFALLQRLILHARGVCVRQLVEQTRATFELVSMVAEKLEQVMFSQRKFRYDDVTRRVASYDFSRQAGSLGHRLNATTHHLFLDEFQDTSMPQWKIIEPLATEVASRTDGTFFCVGDIKQAIYAWRGGVAAIFDQLQKRLERDNLDVVLEEMNLTRRNTQPVLDAVNAVFTEINTNAAVLAASPAAGAAWQARFHCHETANTGDGYCVIETSPDEDATTPQYRSNDEEDDDNADFDSDSSKPDLHLDYVVERLVQIVDTFKNRPLKNGIGVLVQRNETGGQIVDRLRRHGIETSGSGAALSDSVAVQYVVSALRLADHPGNGIARFHVANSPPPFAEFLGLTPEANEADAMVCSQRLRKIFMTCGYGEFVKQCIEHLAASCDSREFHHLEKLLDLAYLFDDEATGTRSEALIAKIEKARIVSPSAAPIHVMTIHGAKGLEFDVVVLPELDYALKKERLDIVTGHAVRDDFTSPIDFVLCYPNKNVQSILPPNYRATIERQRQGEVEESLSKLYVAMTRAIHELVMIVKPKLKSSETFAAILRSSSLARDAASCSAPNVLYECGNPNWATVHAIRHARVLGGHLENPAQADAIATFAQANLDASALGPRRVRGGDDINREQTPPPQEIELRFSDAKINRHVRRVTPSRLRREMVADDDNAVSAGRSREEAMLFGTAIHACFEHVIWIDDARSRDDATFRVIASDAVRRNVVSFTADDVVAEFRRACGEREIADVLSRGRYAAENVVVERERRLVVWVGDEVLRGTVDRLVIERDAAGQIVGLEVLDYKTDHGTDLNALVVRDRDQIEAYRSGVASLFGVPPEIVRATLVFVTLGKVVTV
ncbi:MAG: UvrD-helicase domain-containing protein [Thermoguttaceae bacterium]